MIFGGEFEEEDRTEMMNFGGYATALEDGVKVVHETTGALGQPVLQGRSRRFQMLQNRAGGGERQRVAHESAGKESYSGGWIGIVAILPHAAVEGVHECRLACQDADGHSAAGHFAIGDKIGADAEQGLYAARMDAEASNDFVKN